MIDVSDVVNDPELGGQAFTIKRPSGALVEGRFVPGVPQSIPVFGNIQPASAEDRAEFLPEGERNQELIRIWSPTEIRMTDGNGQESDLIVWRGAEYRVVARKPWVQAGYWQAWATGLVPEA